MMTNADDWLMGEKRDPSVSWDGVAIGHTVKGKIVRREWVQKRDMNGDLEWWDEEKTQPRMQMIIHLNTGVIKIDHEDHNGVWRLFVAAQKLRDAIKNAVLATGAKKLEEGGILAVTYKGKGKAAEGKPASYRPNLFAAEYWPPSADERAQEKPKVNAGASDEPPF